MEFSEVLRRRRMVRRYLADRPVQRSQLEQLVAAATRAPSAGSSQGWHFLVLDDPAAVEAYWTATTQRRAAEGTPDAWLAGMKTAPALIIVFSGRQAYVDRYRQPDKRSPGGEPADIDTRWPVPYWHLDAAMAALLILLAAVDHGLGAGFFGVPTGRVPHLRQRFQVPNDLTPVGVISVGFPDPEYRAASKLTRRPISEVVSYGSYGSTDDPDDSSA